MNAWGIAVTMSVAAAAFHASAAVFQERMAGSHVSGPGRRLGTLRLLSKPRWWWAVVLTGIASGLHLVALHFGPLTVVQPLGALTLVLALSLSAALAGRRVTRGEWLGVALTMAGLALLLHLTTAEAPRVALSPDEVLALSVLAVAGTALLVFSAMGARRLVVRSLMHAAAAGICFGIASAMARTVTIRMSDHGWSEALTPATAVMVALAFGGLLLAQAAYRAGVGAPLATLTIVNPIVAGVIGLQMLDERFQAGVGGAVVAGLAAVVAACGVVLLARNRAAVTARRRDEALTAVR
ncbi:DMT family transporter [Phytoactinopolyspora limicola]|uniref:DMT family transporter n=1 Tax=Phytoactinopolyspora limicola TaxID=2715536 RepID=UPI0014080ADB|nr:DMT family transporter [Phytoactinopolyspora limicola]